MKGPSDAELERRCNELFDLAAWYGRTGRTAEQLEHADQALAICRLLHKRSPDSPRHIEALAGGLYNQAGRRLHAGQVAEAEALLAEADACYAALDPRRFGVHRADVQQRLARARLVAHDWETAVRLYQDAIRMYEDAPTDNPVERDFDIVRAHTGIGCCLLFPKRYEAALAEFDAALFAAERLREEAGIEATEFSWLARAPHSFQLAAPEWMSAAVCAMELHDAAGRWEIAADAANIAVRVSGAMAAIDDGLRQRFEFILARAQEIWQAAEHPVRAAALRAGPFGEVMVGGRRGPAVAPDLDRMLALAGWADLRR